MLQWLIEFSLRHRVLVLAAAMVCAAAGVAALRQLDLDAFPDTTPVMVQINTTAPALGPEEVERQITYPIEQAISGLPGLQTVRSISKFGLSQVVVVFHDSINVYFARQLITERLTAVELPVGVPRPQLGPVSSGLGEVFQYIVTYEGADSASLSPQERVRQLTELRTLHDWVIKPQLRSVPGVAEVNSWGGYEKQYQVRVDPELLIKHSVTWEQVAEALANNNQNVGGGAITDRSRMLLVLGVGRTTSLEQIENIVIVARDGAPIRVRDVAEVQVGHEIRRGAVTANGRGEVVLGLAFTLMGENTHRVTQSIKNKLQEISQMLPPGVKIETVYDRTQLVEHVIDTVRANLLEGGLLVIAILFLFLGNLRAGLIVASVIPLSMLFAFSGMWYLGIAASLLSLGAIDFGLIVDSSVVMVENCVRKLADDSANRNRLDIVREAAYEVRKPTMFGELIIAIVYLPILTLESVEGKLFRPMALTVIMALAASMILSLTLMPVLASLLLTRGMSHKEPILIRVVKFLYAPLLRFSMRHKWLVLLVALAVVTTVCGMIAPYLGTEFVPRLSEEAMGINLVRPAGTDLEETIRYNTQIEQVLLEQFPNEIQHVWSRVGTGDVATDPMGLEVTDLYITLRPRSQWKRAHTQDELAQQIIEQLRELPGFRFVMSQPIEMRINEMTSGVRSDLAVTLYGDDLELMVAKAAEIEQVLRSIDGASEVQTEQVAGQPVLRLRIKQDEIGRYGIPARAVLEIIEGIGGKPVGEVYEGQLRFPLVIRLPDSVRSNPDAIRSLLITTPAGERIPLERLANVDIVETPTTIRREWYQRRISVEVNVRGRDLGSFVAEAKRKVREQVALPAGRYRIEWGGQFEHLERAQRRLMIVVPLVVLLVFSLLYLTYRNIVDAVRVLTAVPFAWVGGIIALWVRDMPFSISAAIGFVVLSGVAILDDMLLVSTIRGLHRLGRSLDQAIQEAAMIRLRPILMTTLVAALGFLPMAVSTGVGAEVQRPLATVVIGGVCSATIMSLLVLRVLYVIFHLPDDNNSS